MPALRYLPRYTVDDYRCWEGDWELWDGIPVSMTPSPFGRHQQVCRDVLFRLMVLMRESGCSCEAIHELDWIVDRNTVVRPDVMVLCDGIPERHITTRPDLIVEVLSEATKHKDQTAKRELYQREQVPYYFLIDPADATVRGYALQAGQYQSIDAPDGRYPIRFADHDCQFVFSV